MADDRFLMRTIAALDRSELAGQAIPDSIPTWFSWLRQHLEANGLKDKHPTLAFYCDWLVHPKLDRLGANDLLSRLDRSLADNGDNPNINDEICLVLSLRELRRELVSLLGDRGRHYYLLDTKQGWRQLLCVVLGELVDKPVCRRSVPPEGRVATLLLRVSDLTETDPEYAALYESGTIFWEFMAKNQVRYTGPLAITESDDAFARR